jgi:hypothetical protein
MYGAITSTCYKVSAYVRTEDAYFRIPIGPRVKHMYELWKSDIERCGEYNVFRVYDAMRRFMGNFDADSHAMTNDKQPQAHDVP